MRCVLFALIASAVLWSAPAAADDDTSAAPSFLPGGGLPAFHVAPVLRFPEPRPMRSSSWLVGGTIDLDQSRIVGVELEDVAEIDWLSVMTGVGGANAATAARLSANRGRLGADLGASLTAEAGPLDPAAALKVWGSLDACAYVEMTSTWQLEAFVGAAESLNTANEASQPRLVGGFTLRREL